MKQAIIYLTTPLLSDSENAVPAKSYRIKGEVVALDVHGITFHVKSYGTDHGWMDLQSTQQIFLPMHKVDFAEMKS